MCPSRFCAAGLTTFDGGFYFMAKDLQWFKFSPLDWMTGRIRKESAKVQIAFLELMCQYWKNDCQMTKSQAELEIGDAIQPLIKKQLIKVSGDYIKIQFLDEQMVSIDETSAQRSNAAKSRWIKEHSKTMQVHASALQKHKGALQNDAEKIREDKIREEKSYYPSTQKAFEDISNNYLETEPQRNILSNRGWRSAGKTDTDGLLYHFLESQVDLKIQDRSDVKSHFKKWLNKRPIEELQTLAKKINERFQTKVS